MVINKNYHGIPIAYILFSAKEETSLRGTHSDYTTAFLTELISHWVQAMGKNSLGETFEPRVVITDNDIRECTVLSTQWLSVLLLLCLFHMWQAWQASLNRCLSGIPKGDDWAEIRSRLAQLCMRL